MKLGANVAEQDAQAVEARVRDLLLPGETLELIVQGSHDQSPIADHIVVTDSRVFHVSLKKPSTEPSVMTLDNCERVEEVKVLHTRVLRWDGSTVDLGMLRRRREDEQMFVETVTAIMERAPDFQDRKIALTQRVVKIVGHKYADDGGVVAKRRLHAFLGSDETIEFVCQIKAARGFEADSLALTSSRVLLFESNAFGEEPVFAMPYEQISNISTQKGDITVINVDGSSTALGKLRHGKQDLGQVDSIFGRFGPQVVTPSATAVVESHESPASEQVAEVPEVVKDLFEVLLDRGQPLVGHRYKLDDLRRAQSELAAGLQDDESLVVVVEIRSTKPFANRLLFTSHRAIRLRAGSRDALEGGVWWSERPVMRLVDGEIRIEKHNGSEERFAPLRHPKDDAQLLVSAIRAVQLLPDGGELSVEAIEQSSTAFERPTASLDEVEYMTSEVDSGPVLAALRGVQWPVSDDEIAERLWISSNRVTLLTSHQLIGWKSNRPSDGNRAYRRNADDIEILAQATLDGSGVSWLVIGDREDSGDLQLIPTGQDFSMAAGVGVASVTAAAEASEVAAAVVFQSHLVYFDQERLAVWNLRKDPACEFSIPTRSVTGLFLTRDGIVVRSVDAFVHEIPLRSSRDSELFPGLERAWRLVQSQIPGLAQPKDISLGENVLSLLDREISIWSTGKNAELRSRFSVDELNAVLLDGDTLIISANGRPTYELKNLGTHSEAIFSNLLDTLRGLRPDLVSAEAASDWLSGLAASSVEHFGSASARVYDLMSAAFPSSPVPYGSERLPMIGGEFEADGKGDVTIVATDARLALLPTKKWQPRGGPRTYSHAQVAQISVEIDVIENIASSGKVRERHRLLVNVWTTSGERIPLTYELGSSLAERNSKIQAPFSGLRSLIDFGWPVVFEGESTRRFYAQSSTPRMGFGIGIVSFD